MGSIWRVSGPVVIADGMKGSQVYEMVEIGPDALIGEIIGLEEDRAVIQAHEDTLGLEIGQKVAGTGRILTAELGPGIVGSIYDGLQKSLTDLMAAGGTFIRSAITTGPETLHMLPMLLDLFPRPLDLDVEPDELLQ